MVASVQDPPEIRAREETTRAELNEHVEAQALGEDTRDPHHTMGTLCRKIGRGWRMWLSLLAIQNSPATGLATYTPADHYNTHPTR